MSRKLVTKRLQCLCDKKFLKSGESIGYCDDKIKFIQINLSWEIVPGFNLSLLLISIFSSTITVC